jgi:hypothetical protein
VRLPARAARFACLGVCTDVGGAGPVGGASSRDRVRDKAKGKDKLLFYTRVLIECLDFHASNKLVNSVLAFRDGEWLRLPVYLLVKGDVVSLSSADEERLPKKILRLLDTDLTNGGWSQRAGKWLTGPRR